MKASTAPTLGHGWCAPKAVLLAAVARAAGIPARLGFADVCNPLSTEGMHQTMQATTGDFAKAATQKLGGWVATGAGPG